MSTKGPKLRTLSRSPAYSTEPESLLLGRLDHLKKFDKGWRARCPSHGSDRNRALSVTIADDGLILLHCFAGCGAADVLGAIGLELKDLYPERLRHNATPVERHELKRLAKQSQWAAALEVLNLEARIVAVAADQIAEGEALNDQNRQRLGQALERITGARLVLSGH